MDFTGPYGRIVEDPQEAKAIAVAEGYFWKRRRKPSGRQTPCANQVMTWPFKWSAYGSGFNRLKFQRELRPCWAPERRFPSAVLFQPPCPDSHSLIPGDSTAASTSHSLGFIRVYRVKKQLNYSANTEPSTGKRCLFCRVKLIFINSFVSSPLACSSSEKVAAKLESLSCRTSFGAKYFTLKSHR